MQYENEPGVRLNAYGEPDVEYYLAQAHQMRGQALAAGFRELKACWLRALDRSWFMDQGRSSPPQKVVQSGWPWVDLIVQGTPTREVRHV